MSSTPLVATDPWAGPVSRPVDAQSVLLLHERPAACEKPKAAGRWPAARSVRSSALRDPVDPGGLLTHAHVEDDDPAADGVAGDDRFGGVPGHEPLALPRPAGGLRVVRDRAVDADHRADLAGRGVDLERR